MPEGSMSYIRLSGALGCSSSELRARRMYHEDASIWQQVRPITAQCNLVEKGTTTSCICLALLPLRCFLLAYDCVKKTAPIFH